MVRTEIDQYQIKLDTITVSVSIYREEGAFVPTYFIKLPKLEEATLALLEDTKDKLLSTLPIKIEELRDPVTLASLRNRVKNTATKFIKESITNIPSNVLEYTAVFLANEMLGLGNVDFLLADENLEEVVVNNSKTPIWVYHRKHGWLKTNVIITDESLIENYASIIGRRVGRQITLLDPLMDAHLLSGDRVNATLFPISTFGNTLTIRKFRRKPWTITDLIKNNTVDPKIASFLWLCMQYELSLIIGGGTASGKTTFLNVLLSFIPPNERIISIEQTRELNLPSFLHWVPMSTREPNPEGKGEVSMLDLMINSLRMRPDRVIVGEIRRQPEAEVLFEALNTGHSVYSTLHANTAQEAFRRLTSPPINLPPELIQSLPLFSIMFRHRKMGIRRLFETAEIVPGEKINLNQLYLWDVKSDNIKKRNNSIRAISDLNLFTGMTPKEIDDDLTDKEKIIKWFVKNNVDEVDRIGYMVSEYYADKEGFLKKIASNKPVKKTGGE